jgi:hypothetical protein
MLYHISEEWTQANLGRSNKKVSLAPTLYHVSEEWTQANLSLSYSLASNAHPLSSQGGVECKQRVCVSYII